MSLVKKVLWAFILTFLYEDKYTVATNNNEILDFVTMENAFDCLVMKEMTTEVLVHTHQVAMSNRTIAIESFEKFVLPQETRCSGQTNTIVILSWDNSTLTNLKKWAVLDGTFTYLVIGFVEAEFQQLAELPLRLDSRLFVTVKNDSNSEFVFDVYKIYSGGPIVTRECGIWTRQDDGSVSSSCTLSQDLNQNRIDFGGVTLTAVYEFWDPYCLVNLETGELLGGIFYELFEDLAISLNFTTRYVRADPLGVWGMQLPDGNWTGIIGAIARGEVDTSVAGVAVTSQRSVVVSWPLMAVRSRPGVFVRTPAVDDISLQAYISEFTFDVWMTILAYLVLVSLGMMIILWRTHKEVDSLYQRTCAALQITMRALIGKGTTGYDKKKSLPFQFGLMVVLLSGFVIFTSYRSAMNAFLAVRITKLPINNLQDVYDKDYGLVMWENGVLESALNSSEKDSLQNRLYRKALNDDNLYYMKDTAHGLDLMADEKLVIFEYVESISVMKDYYPCKVIYVPDIKLVNVYLSIPFKLDSPYLKAIEAQLSKDLETGKVDKVLQKYMVAPNLAQTTKCGDLQNSLGFANTFLPFVILGGAAGLSFIVLFVEWLMRPWGAKQEKSELGTSNDDMKRTAQHKDDLMQIWTVLVNDNLATEEEKLEHLRRILNVKY